jgi:hypothetical protein
MVRIPLVTGIPPLAGLCTYREATRSETTVTDTVALLRRLARIEHRTLLVLSAHLNAVPEWEVKCALALHIWQDAEHCSWLRQRVTEMRKPPHYLDRSDDPALDVFFEELVRSQTTRELLTGVYGLVKPSLLDAIGALRRRDNPLADHPTLRLLRFLELEEREQVDWGQLALAALGGPDVAWDRHLSAYLEAAGGVGGDGARGATLPPQRACEPLEVVRTPRRDRRFTRLWDSRGRLPGYDASADQVNWRMAYIRLTEMHAVELLALTLYEWPEAGFETHRALARHLWDEARHSMFGEVVFETHGVDWHTVPHDLSFASYPNSKLEPRERYALLYRSEHAVMSDTKQREVGMLHAGKRTQHAAARASGDRLVTLFQDFDWADEVLHVNIARRILADVYATREERDEAGARAAAGLEAIVERDLALNRSGWWDAFYAEVQRAATTREPTPPR